MWGPDNGDDRDVWKENEEEEVEDCDFLFLLLGDSSLRADRSLVFVFLSFGIFLKDSSVTCLFDLFTLFHIFLNFFFFWYFPYFFFLFCCNLYFFPPLSFGSLMQIYMVNSPFFPIFGKILFKISVSSFLNVY